ncbi:hypothetical protein DMENIID0001_117970 [Sergentomyia squamirostris]
MKYPQLVSARAVSAISDWLISRLEDLGVDAPVVYSRLLLSLLHTPLQVNALDLAEIPQLQGWLTRKNRRLTPPDAEALKKFAAVESLMEVASSDQQKSNVEDLVNELCKRLREIENQNSSDYDEESVEMEAKKINDSATKTEDPTKRYYRAFPALSNREEVTEAAMMSSALTWPNQAGGGGSDEGPEVTSDDKTATITPGGSASNVSAGVKRKNKRRRNNGLSKGKSSTFTRRTSTGSNNTKTPLWDTDFSGNWEMGHDMIRDFIIRQNNRNRSISESDASKFVKINDFMQSPVKSRHSEGERNMNHILLKECRDEDFKLPQGVTVNEEQTMLIKNMLQSSKGGTFRKESLVNFEPSHVDEEVFLTERGDVSPFFGSFNTNNLLFGNNLIRDEGYATPDTLTSMSEVESTSAAPPRRLYEREVSNESLNSCLQAPKVTKSDDDNIAQFEAKFNKSMEALWDTSATLQEDNKANSFWNNYYRHHYDEEIPKNVSLTMTAPEAQEDDSGWPAKIPSLNDMMVEARKNCSNTDLHAIWAAPDTTISSASSSQASAAPSTDNSGWAVRYLDKANTLNKFPHEPEMNVMGYPLSDFIGLSKWSEQPFMCDDDTRRVDQFYEECKSLPITYANYSQAFTPGASFGTGDSTDKHDEEEVHVSLMNHSKESRFAVVKKFRHGHVFRGQTGKFRGFIGSGGGGGSGSTAENENLLTSEKTHFRPIKQTFVDGFIFDIPCTPDNIRYERTDSGSMYFDSEKYMEYIGRDEHAEEEDVESRDGKKLPNFTLKFCVRQIEKYSQTEDRLLCLSEKIFTEPSMGMLRCPPDSGEDSDVDMTPDIFSRHFGYDEDSSENCDDLDLLRATNYLYSAAGGAAGGSCFNGGGECLDVDNWTMAEMKKNCVENNNSHTLWGHCSTCNNSTMSLPANRLLRDELCADGDEILSDLRYMQNLYIGEVDDDSEWDEDNEEDDEEEMDELESFAEPEDPAKNIYYNVNKLISDLLRPETVKTLTQVLGEKSQKSILEGILQEKEEEPPFWRDTWTYSGSEFANSSFWPVSSSTRWPVNLDKNLNEPTETTWSDWKECQGVDREEISYNLSDDHFRALMRASPVNNPVTRVRPDRKRRHSASQNLTEDFAISYKFHGNPMLKESWDNFDHVPSESVFRPVHPAGKSSTTGRSALNASSLFNRVTMVSRPLTR